MLVILGLVDLPVSTADTPLMRFAMHRAAVLAATVLLTSSCSPVLQSGSHVRLTAPAHEPARVEGVLQRVERDHLVIRPSDTDRTFSIPRQEITSLEVGSRSRKTGTGALIGLISFGLLGAVTVDPEICEPEPGYCLVVGAIVAAGAGALLGALVGAFIRGEEEWNRVPLDRVHGDRR